jgi:hypothetical protein
MLCQKKLVNSKIKLFWWKGKIVHKIDCRSRSNGVLVYRRFGNFFCLLQSSLEKHVPFILQLWSRKKSGKSKLQQIGFEHDSQRTPRPLLSSSQVLEGGNPGLGQVSPRLSSHTAKISFYRCFYQQVTNSKAFFNQQTKKIGLRNDLCTSQKQMHAYFNFYSNNSVITAWKTC